MQKEAFFFEKPCVTLRDETEWVELVESGFDMLSSSDRVKIIEAADKMKNDMVTDENGMYGAGQVVARILHSLVN